MYSRDLLFKRYSRLAALYSILEIGRQPSLGGRGFALADAQASSDAMMTTATGKLFWRNEMGVSIFSRALPLRRQLLQQRLRRLLAMMAHAKSAPGPWLVRFSRPPVTSFV